MLVKNFIIFKLHFNTFKLHNFNLISHYIKFNVFITEKYISIYIHVHEI